MKYTDNYGFRIKFDGDLNQINAHTYLNTLFSLTGIIEEINDELKKQYKVDKNINIKINSHEKGSFIVNLILDVHIQDFIKTILKAENIQYCAAAVTILTGLYGFRKFLKNDRIKNINKDGDNIQVNTDKGNNIIINKEVYNIYNNSPKANQEITNQCEALMNDDYVKGFSIENDKKKTLFKATKKDIELIAEYEDDVPEENKKTIVDDQARLNIVKIGFEKKYKWDFYYKGQKISARIRDDTFQRKIDQGESFSKGDVLIVKLEINKVFDKSVDAFINKSYKIINVKEHIPRRKQESLFNKNKEKK